VKEIENKKIRREKEITGFKWGIPECEYNKCLDDIIKLLTNNE
jgi:hypothetical protein